jgi:hypothetical protein
MSRMDVLQPRKGKDDKTYYTKIGVAFPTKDGTGYMISFEALPMPGPDGCRVLMMPPREQDAPPRASGGRAEPSRAARVGHDADEIPFAAEWR